MASLLSGRTLLAVTGLLALAFAFARLGVWQLERADETRDLRARFAAGSDAEPLRDVPRALADADRFRRLHVRGAYVEAPQFLLDNMIDHGTAGYHVLTPLRLEGHTRWLLVNRGWVPAGADRSTLPEVTVATEPRELTGRLERLPRPGISLGEPEPLRRGAAVSVVEFPTADELASALGEALYDYQLLLDPAEPDGYARVWQPPGPAPERNLAYAGQWLLLAVGAGAAAVVVLVKRWRSPA